MAENSQRLVYSEVYGILKSLGKTYINLIPKKLYKIIEEERDKDYNPTYNIDMPLAEQKVSKKAAALICMLHYNYWCTSYEEKEKINEILKYNTKCNRENYFEFEKKFIKNKLVNDKQKDIEIGNINSLNSKCLIKEDKTTIINKIINFIKKIFYTIF